MLQRRVLCVRCATSYEVALSEEEVECFLPFSSCPLPFGSETDELLEEAYPPLEEPLELPAPLLMGEPLSEGESVLEELVRARPCQSEACLQLSSDAPAEPEQPEQSTEPLPTQENESAPLEPLFLLPEEAAPEPLAEEAMPFEAEEPLSLEDTGVEAAQPVVEAAPVPEEAAPILEESAPVLEEEAAPAFVEDAPAFDAEPTFEESPALFETVEADEAEDSPSYFEAEVLADSAPATESRPEVEQEDSLPDFSQAPESMSLPAAAEQGQQPVGFVPPTEGLPNDKYAVGVRLMRVSPAWLMLSGLLFISLIFVFNWATKPNAQANNLTFGYTSTNSASNQSAPVKPIEKRTETAVPNTAQGSGAPSSTAEPSSAAVPSPAGPAPIAEAAPQTRPAPSAIQPPQSETKAAPPAPAKTESSTPASGNFTVQVGSYSDNAQAEGRAQALRSAGFEARILKVELPQRGTWYRVQSGRFPTREEATRYGQQLRERKAAGESIVTEVGK